MIGKTVIFSKQSDEPHTPLTVRIEWLPDGSIRPVMYWTPDGTCYKVIARSEHVPLSFLQGRLDGLRFKVVGEIIETPEPNDERLHNRCETYLYLADHLFCQKNIIDGRYGHPSKEYISVAMDVFPDCQYELLYFWVHGMRYKVEKTNDIEPRGSFHTGGVGIWHRVEARLVNAEDDGDPVPHQSVRRPAGLTLELNKWFVPIARQCETVNSMLY